MSPVHRRHPAIDGPMEKGVTMNPIIGRTQYKISPKVPGPGKFPLVFDILGHHTWTLAQLQTWVDEFGPWMMHAGEQYYIKHRLIVPGRYDVWFESRIGDPL